MSTAHTPGPWRCDRRDILAADGQCIASIFSGPCATLEEADANGRLVAAAPELLRCAEMALEELEEAARIDGANEWQIFFHVILPLVKPALGTVVTFGFIMIWDQYLLPLIVVNHDSLNTIPVILGSLRTDESITPNIFIAITLLAMLPSIIVYLGLQKHFNRGIMSGAVKG